MLLHMVLMLVSFCQIQLAGAATASPHLIIAGFYVLHSWGNIGLGMISLLADPCCNFNTHPLTLEHWNQNPCHICRSSYLCIKFN
ncbi:hypothetical protein P692DRAFT_20337732 [Suillus brevipes Sb2]|nr:hypothetical protein P692DRAFT_20337732 [Suillus brevipes Sb2]